MQVIDADERRTPVLTLPIELSDYIISLLADDFSALHAASLTCRLWLRATRPLRFPRAKLLGCDLQHRFYKTFKCTLPSLPDPLQSMRQLTVVLHSQCTVFALPQELLVRLSAVTTLCVHSWGYGMLHEGGGAQALLLPDYFPRVQRLQFRDLAPLRMDDYLRLIGGFPSLNALEVLDPFPAPALGPAKRSSVLRPLPPTLRELSLASCSPYAAAVARSIVGGAARGPIEVLQLDGLDDKQWDHGALLAAVAPTLCELHLRANSENKSPKSPDIFAVLQAAPLERLSISFPFLLTGSDDRLEWVAAVLAHTQPARLRTVDICIRFSLHGLARFARWPELDAQLARLSSRAPRLRVRFALSFLSPPRGSEGSVEAYRKKVLTHLPQCRAQGTEIAVAQ